MAEDVTDRGIDRARGLGVDRHVGCAHVRRQPTREVLPGRPAIGGPKNSERTVGTWVTVGGDFRGEATGMGHGSEERLRVARVDHDAVKATAAEGLRAVDSPARAAVRRLGDTESVAAVVGKVGFAHPDIEDCVIGRMNGECADRRCRQLIADRLPVGAAIDRLPNTAIGTADVVEVRVRPARCDRGDASGVGTVSDRCRTEFSPLGLGGEVAEPGENENENHGGHREFHRSSPR